MRLLAVLVVLAGASGCSKPPVPIVDLSRSLEPLRIAFDAHRGEPRFLTLLSPT